MDRSGNFSLRYLELGLMGILAVCGGCGGSPRQTQPGATTSGAAPATTIAPLSADDVSILFPAPTRAADFANIIAVSDLTAPNLQDPTKRDAVWPDGVFQQFLAIAASPAAQVAGTATRIGLPSEAQSKNNRFIAGIRIDAGAPGLSSEVQGQFGRSPEIRLIVQPVIRNSDGTPKVDDIAGHLIFDFSTFGAPAQAGSCHSACPILRPSTRLWRTSPPRALNWPTGSLERTKSQPPAFPWACTQDLPSQGPQITFAGR